MLIRIALASRFLIEGKTRRTRQQACEMSNLIKLFLLKLFDVSMPTTIYSLLVHTCYSRKFPIEHLWLVTIVHQRWVLIALIMWNLHVVDYLIVFITCSFFIHALCSLRRMNLSFIFLFVLAYDRNVRMSNGLLSGSFKMEGCRCWCENRTSPSRAAHVTPRSVSRRARQSDLLIDNGKY
jgi:hypothetical protein